MTESKEVCEADFLQLNTNKSKGTPDSSYNSELDDIPSSLVGYFETSKSRAAACEKLILGELEDDNPENEKDFPLNISDHQTEREKPHHEQVQKREQRQQREMDFQEELRRIIEAEKFQQMELELRKRNALEKLEQELQLQQEIISNFKKQVEKDRMMIEEEKRRKSEEEIKMKEKEDRVKKEEEDQRKKREENHKAMEVRLNKESERRMAEDMRKKEEDEKRKRKEEKTIREDGIRREKEEMRRRVEQEERSKKEETEEKRCFMVTGKMMMMESGDIKKDEVKLKDELKTMKEKDNKEKRQEEDLRISSLSKVRVSQGEKRKEEDEDREDKQPRRKILENEMQHRECEEKRMIDKWKGLCLKNECILRKKEEKGRGKEMEEQGLETDTQKEEEQGNTEEENKVKQERKGSKGYEKENREREDLKKTDDEDKRLGELKDLEEKDDNQIKVDGTKGAEVDMSRAEKDEQIETVDDRGGIEAKKELPLIDNNDLEENQGENDGSELQNSDRTGKRVSLMFDPSLSEATTKLSISEATQCHHPDGNISDTSAFQTDGQTHPDSKCPASSRSLPASLHEHTEQKRLSWMEHCVPWSELSLQNKRKQKRSFQSQRRARRAVGVSGLAPLCPHTVLESTGRKSLQEVTIVTLEDLPPCSLSTLAQCNHLQSLTLRRCGLRSLEGISQLQELCYMDLGENEISFLDCENMSNLRVLRLAHNKLTSIPGLSDACSLDVLDLAYNSITRIAGLECVTRLQRLSVDHNQLISTKGLRDVYTLHHLDCSHNYLVKVEGLENSALLHTLDLRSNSLTEPPSLNNQVLLRELLLDDNSISSLQGLAGCWLPLLQHLSVAQNRITQLPSMTDFVSLKNLDLRLNCLSELQDVCENLEGCLFLQEVHLTGNPLQQESDWKFRLQKAVAGLRAVDSQQTDSVLSSLASRQLSLAPDSFLTLCQVQLRQTQDLQQRLSRELRNASSSLDAMKSCCHHFTLALQLSEDQRFAHEYGDITVFKEHMDAGQAMPEKTLDMDSRSLGNLKESLKTESTVRRPPDNEHQHNYCHFEDTPDEKSRQDTFGSVTTGQRSTAESNDAKGFVHLLPSNDERTFTSLDIQLDNLDSKNKAATVLQRMWRIYREKCGRAKASFIPESRGHAEKPLFELSSNNMSSASQDHAATVIQAFWRGCALRRRLASALAAFTCPDTGEEDTFEEVDVNEFVVDEPALDEHWTLPEDSSPMHYPVTEQHLSPKQAWVAEEQGDPVAERYSAGRSRRSKSPASALVHSGLSERSEKILQEWGFTNSRTALLMLKRAQKMKANKPQQKKHGNPSFGVAFSGFNYQINPAEARNRPAGHSRRSLKVGEPHSGLQRAKRMEQMRWQQAPQQLQTQVALHDQLSEREHFLPQIDLSVLSRGRVQLVADLAYGDNPSATGLCSNSSLTTQLGEVNRSNLTHPSKNALPPKRVTSPGVKKERISFWDNPVQLSSGWGGGKKRDRLLRK
ncbi:leucine-rich repeat- and IQ domain-containing protein 1 [Anableps anableps]